MYLRRDPDYWDAENVDVDEIDLVVISDTQQAVMAYQNGDVDNVTLTGDMVSMYQDDPEFSNVLGSFNYYLMVNTTKDGYDNKDSASGNCICNRQREPVYKCVK